MSDTNCALPGAFVKKDDMRLGRGRRADEGTVKHGDGVEVQLLGQRNDRAPSARPSVEYDP